MAHLISILFTLGLLVGLMALLERTVRESGPAIRNALRGSGATATPFEAAIEGIGRSLRASFPALGREESAPDLERLLRQLSARTSTR